MQPGFNGMFDGDPDGLLPAAGSGNYDNDGRQEVLKKFIDNIKSNKYTN